MLKDWKIAYKKQNKENSDIYANYSKGLWIQRAGKQLGAFDNFKEEKYPVVIQSTGGSEVERKWFDTAQKANGYMRNYMRSH